MRGLVLANTTPWNNNQHQKTSCDRTRRGKRPASSGRPSGSAHLLPAPPRTVARGPCVWLYHCAWPGREGCSMPELGRFRTRGPHSEVLTKRSSLTPSERSSLVTATHSPCQERDIHGRNTPPRCFRVRGPHCSLSQAQGGRDVTGVTPHASTRGRCPARDGSERTSLDYYAAP